MQVPAGTVRPGETPEVAVLREATEETGLTALRIERHLGAAEYDVRPYRDEVHVRHYFQLSVGQDEVPEQWYAEEHGDGDIVPIRLRLYWLPLPQAHVVSAAQAAYVGRLFD